MADWTRADVRLYAAELSGVPDPTIDAWIVEADTEIDARVFGQLVRRAGANLTAHLLVMNGAAASYGVPIPGGPSSGAVTGVRVGEVSVSYAAPSNGSSVALSDAALDRTRWGTEFKRLRNMMAGGPWLADAGDE